MNTHTNHHTEPVRRLAREMALKFLFEQEFHQAQASTSASATHHLPNKKEPNKKGQIGAKKYCMQIVKGIQEEKSQIDCLISDTSQFWKLNRMSLIDLNIMRIAIFEMLCAKPPVPFKVCINEAIEIAKIYGTNDSSAFINGILHTLSNRTKSDQTKPTHKTPTQKESPKFIKQSLSNTNAKH